MDNFHFLQPQWFYLLIPSVLLLWALLKNKAGGESAWQKVIDENLLPWLSISNSGVITRLPVYLLSVAWFIALIALANPVWERLPQPVFQTDMAHVIVLDLSRSMNSEDIKPSRLERARFKVSDLLKMQQEGVIGLVVFAGDAFVVSPLTRDADTISAMLPALKPDIMPIQGSRADLGLAKAVELMKQAGRLRGEIVLLADSYTDERTLQVAESLRKQGFITSVMGLGTEQATPLPTGQGGHYRNNDGKVITTRLDKAAMKNLARSGGGVYVDLSADDADIKALMTTRVESSRHDAGTDSFETTRWKETGPWLVILLLPLAALAFRRGWLLSLCILAITMVPNEPAMAFSLTDLWQRQDQQAHKALIAGDVEQAAELARDPLTKGAAEFRQGDYDAAVEAFSASDSAEAAYNKGNALAKLGKLEEAIESYDKALKTHSDMPDAEFNRAAVEELLQQQKEQQQKNKDQQGDQDQDQTKDGNKDGDKSQEQGGQKSQGQPGQDGAENQQDNGQEGQQNDGNSKDNENAFSDAAEQLKKQSADSQNQDGKDEQAKAEQQQSAEKSGDDVETADTAEKDSGSAAEDAGQEAEQNNQTPDAGNSRSSIEAEELSSEEQIAAEQWLRRIPDDPAGLLRRKLRYQYIQRGGDSRITGDIGDAQPW